ARGGRESARRTRRSQRRGRASLLDVVERAVQSFVSLSIRSSSIDLARLEDNRRYNFAVRWHTAVALFLAVALAVSLRAVAAQVTIMRYARQRNAPVNFGLPDIQRGFTFCRLRYERTRRQRKSGWWDDYPASDFNFLSRFEELTTVSISRWANGDPGFAQVTLQDPDLFRCPFLKMQGAA